MAELDAAVAGRGAVKDVLTAVCVLADWNPVCTRLEHQHLQVCGERGVAAASACRTQVGEKGRPHASEPARARTVAPRDDCDASSQPHTLLY